jgi:hypothetical protein
MNPKDLPVSKCCGAEARYEFHANESRKAEGWYCRKCHKVCDVTLAPSKEEKVHSTGFLQIDPLCQIFMDFYASMREENPEGKTKVINYIEWADKIRKLMSEDCACHEPLKENVIHSKYECHGGKYGVLRAGIEKTCCGTNFPLGKCSRGMRKGCNGSHCKCMDVKCDNTHYVDCFDHYIHVENAEENQVLDKILSDFDEKFYQDVTGEKVFGYLAMKLDDGSRNVKIATPGDVRHFILEAEQKGRTQAIDDVVKKIEGMKAPNRDNPKSIRVAAALGKEETRKGPIACARSDGYEVACSEILEQINTLRK